MLEVRNCVPGSVDVHVLVHNPLYRDSLDHFFFYIRSNPITFKSDCAIKYHDPNYVLKFPDMMKQFDTPQ